MLPAGLLAVVVGLAVVADPPSVAAADPTLGATLGASDREVVIDSSASVSVIVELSAPPGWRLEQWRFELPAGGHAVVPILESGEAGQIVATFTAADERLGTDRTSLVLALGTPRTPVPWWPFLLPIPILGPAVLAWWRRRHHKRAPHVRERIPVVTYRGLTSVAGAHSRAALRDRA